MGGLGSHGSAKAPCLVCDRWVCFCSLLIACGLSPAQRLPERRVAYPGTQSGCCLPVRVQTVRSMVDWDVDGASAPAAAGFRGESPICDADSRSAFRPTVPVAHLRGPSRRRGARGWQQAVWQQPRCRRVGTGHRASGLIIRSGAERELAMAGRPLKFRSMRPNV